MKALRLAVSILILLMLCQAALSARGQAAIDLSYADKLIAQRDYNAAQTYLKEYMLRYPQYWEEAQKRLTRINRLREEYNSTTEALIKLLIEDPGNEAKKLEYTNRLQNLGKNANKSQQEFLEKINITAAFRVNQETYENIFKRGRSLLDASEYVKAARLYQEGYVLYKAEFDAAPSNATAIVPVNEGLARIDSALLKFEGLQQSLAQAAQTVRQTIAGEPEILAAAIDAHEETLRNLIETRNIVASEGLAFENRFNAQKALNPELTDSGFLPFAFRFTSGQKSADISKAEGIVGSMDSQLAAILDDWENRIDSALRTNFDDIRKAYDTAAYDSCVSLAERLAKRSVQGRRILAFWEQVQVNENGLRAFEIERTLNRAGKNLAFQFLSSGAELYSKTAQVMKEESSLLAAEEGRFSSYTLASAQRTDPALTNQVVASFLDSRERARDQRNKLQTNINDAARVRQAYERYADGQVGGGSRVESWASMQQDLETRLLAADKKIRADEITLVSRAASIESALLLRGIDGEDKNISRARELITGVLTKTAEQGDLLLKDPAESTSIIVKTGTSLKSTLAGVKALSVKYLNLDPFIVQSEPLREWQIASQDLELRISGLIASATEVERLARGQKQQADSAKLDGDRLLNEARANLRSENFPFALDRLTRARDRYKASLALQWDQRLKDSSSQSADELEASIISARRNKVVRDFRGLITQGTDAYYQSDFERAESLLIQSQTLWRTAYPDNNAEADFWLSLVNTAVSFRSGRIIAPTSPLYSEMSQLLSQAKLLYEEGKASLRRNRKVEALNSFKAAEAKVQEVKVIFPNNQEASVLQLRIKLEVDRNIADRLFKQNFDDARKKIESPQAAARQEGYSDLLILKDINPNYPGLAKQIENAEYALGIRPPPPKAGDISQSRELTANAKRIIDARNRILYQTAIGWLDQAISLYPANLEAKSLKDRLLLDGAGIVQSGQGFSAADARLFQDAEILFSKGQIIDARAAVESLMRNPRNAQNPQLISLKDRIEKALNIR